MEQKYRMWGATADGWFDVEGPGLGGEVQVDEKSAILITEALNFYAEHKKT